MTNALLIFLGGGLGAALRYLLTIWVTSIHAHDKKVYFPFGILSCNLIGCLLIGCLYGYLRAEHPSWLHPLFVTGLLGGFTTFSSFALDTQRLLGAGAYTLAITYILVSLIGGLAACYLGYRITS